MLSFKKDFATKQDKPVRPPKKARTSCVVLVLGHTAAPRLCQMPCSLKKENET